MKVKKLLASTLVASMVVSGVASLNVNNEVSATTVAPAPSPNSDYVGVAANGKAYPNAVLMANAKAKSAKPNHDSEGNAAYAFDNNNGTMWHTNYDASGNEVTSGNPSWIQTGFNTVEKLTKVTYLARNGSANNKILDYELWVSTQENEPNVTTLAVENQEGWKKVQTGKFKEDSSEETITLSTAQDAKWVRLVAISTKHANGNNHAVATKIELFTEQIHYNQNDYAENWDYQVQSGKMSTQDETDRWLFEKLVNSTWSNMETANWSDQWRLYDHYSINRDGFRSPQAHSSVKGLGVSWVAPKDGYFTFTQTKSPGTRGLYDGSTVNLVHVFNNGEATKKLKTPQNARDDVFSVEKVAMKKGDKLRFHTEIKGTANYCDFAGGVAPWTVTDVTKEVADQKITEATALKDNQANANKAESAKQALTDAISKLETAKQGNDNAAIVAAVDALAKATNQFNNDKLFDLATKASTYKWTDTTAQAAQQAIQTALDASATVLTNQQDAIVTLSRALNKSTRLYDVDVLVDGVKNDALSYKDVYNKANTTTISAPATKEGKGDFVGWYKKKGETYLYEVKDAQKLNLDVVASNDVTYEAVYGTAPSVVNTNVGIEMQNSYVSQSGNTYSAKFVGKYFNLPQDATNVEFGLKWGKDGATLTPVKFNSSANKHQQFSLTVNGLTEGHSVTGQVYVKYTTTTGEEVEKTSEQVTLYI